MCSATVADEKNILDDTIKDPNLPKHLSIINTKGKGAYGTVYEVFDHRAGCRRAVKKVTGIFESDETAKRLLREVKLLRALATPDLEPMGDVKQTRYCKISRKGFHGPGSDLECKKTSIASQCDHATRFLLSSKRLETQIAMWRYRRYTCGQIWT
jgi:serine/threonine protein kinase